MNVCIQGVRHRPFHFSYAGRGVKLSRKVLYYFAIDSIVNEILIFENRWNKSISVQPTAKCKRWAMYALRL